MADLTNNNTSLQKVLDAVNNLISVSDITPDTIGAASSSHTQTANTITAGVFSGTVTAQTSSQAPSSFLLRNSKLAATETIPSNNGEICWLYE